MSPSCIRKWFSHGTKYQSRVGESGFAGQGRDGRGIGRLCWAPSAVDVHVQKPCTHNSSLFFAGFFAFLSYNLFFFHVHFIGWGRHRNNFILFFSQSQHRQSALRSTADKRASHRKMANLDKFLSSVKKSARMSQYDHLPFHILSVSKRYKGNGLLCGSNVLVVVSMSVVRLIDWLNGLLIHTVSYRLIDWLIDWTIDPCSVLLIDWLIGWLFHSVLSLVYHVCYLSGLIQENETHHNDSVTFFESQFEVIERIGFGDFAEVCPLFCPLSTVLIANTSGLIWKLNSSSQVFKVKWKRDGNIYALKRSIARFGSCFNNVSLQKQTSGGRGVFHLTAHSAPSSFPISY